MKRKATAEWQGDLKTGKGRLTSDSGALSATPYSFTTRFEGAKGTNPEELLAAAHAGCFTMALSAELGKAKLVPQGMDIETGSPEALASLIREDDARWGKVIRDAGVKPE